MATDKRGRKLPKGIRQRGNTFEGRFMYKGVSYTVQASTITKTQKEMTDLKYKLEHGLYVKKEKITLMEWYETWLEEYKKNRVKIGTYTSYEKYYKSTINNRLGNKELSEIRGEHIQKLYNDMVKEGYAISSIKIVSAILNGCFQQAMKNGLIERNPVKLAELPRQTGAKKGRTAMTKEQQDLFMKYAEESYLYHFFSVMLRTGMRKGEMQGLKYSDIDKKHRSVISANCFPVIGGKISWNASRTGLTTLTNPSKTFFTASIIMVRPPRSFQSCNILFLASAEAFTMLPRALLTSVKSSFASSKSPIIISQL